MASSNRDIKIKLFAEKMLEPRLKTETSSNFVEIALYIFLVFGGIECL